jgi:hypothetical protein
LGLLACELHLAGDWQAFRAWINEEMAACQKPSTEAALREEA